KFGDQIDPSRGFIYGTNQKPPAGFESTVSGFDVSVGMLAFSEVFFVGAAAHHLIQPDESLVSSVTSNIPIKITGHMGAKIPLTNSKYSDGVYVSPNVLYRQQAGFKQLNMGLYVTKGVLT